MCQNKEEPDRPQKTTWRMRTACWITKAVNTHSEYVILTAFPLQKVGTRRRLSVIGTVPVLLYQQRIYLTRAHTDSA